MNTSQWIFAAATLTAALGAWLLLPRGTARGHRLGMVLAAISLGLFASLSTRLGTWVGESIFWILGCLTVAAAAGTISARSPVYSAIWFALVLLGTSGLFLFQGAQFLGVATIVVYAGAILVTFLFVLMLAQPEGHTHYDSLSWEALLSSATGSVMIGMLMMVISTAVRTRSAVAGSGLGGEALARGHWVIVGAILAAALGVILWLPRSTSRMRRLGLLLAAKSLGLFASLSSRVFTVIAINIMWVLVGLAVVAVLGTILARTWARKGVWFGMVVLNAAGFALFRWGGHYFGPAMAYFVLATLLALLFLLLLAEREGNSSCNAVGALMVGMLLITSSAEFVVRDQEGPTRDFAAASVPELTNARNREILAPDHVAHLGSQLFSRHLIAVEVAGALLLAALVGAVAIVAQGKASPALEDIAASSRGLRPGEGSHAR